MNTKFNELLKTSKEDYNLQVNVKRYYTDVDGLIIDKSTVPANLQVSYPFYLFHKFDKNGGYRIGQETKPVQGASKFYYSFDVDLSFDYWQISGNNSIRTVIRSGDTCIIFTDDTEAPTYLIWIVISCPFQAYSSIVNNLARGLKVKDFLYIADNLDNYNEALHINIVNPIGIYKDEQYNPLAFKTRETVSQDFILVKLGFNLNQFIGLFSYMKYDTDSIQFIFNLNQ